ncbi:MAG: hypothetical protein WAM39_17910 [Bryobacteraceae bacterium]
MNFLRRLKYLLPSIRAREEREVDDELRALSAIAAHEAASEGVTPEDIEYAGRRALGNLTLAKEDARAAWGWSWLEDFISDWRFGARQLVRNPVLPAVSILTLALGIGANVAIFSAVYTVLLRPLPFKDARRLVLVHEYKAGNIGKTGSPFVRYLERTEHNDVFEQTGGYWDVSGGNDVVFGNAGIAAHVRFSIVTKSLFPLLGVQPTFPEACIRSAVSATRTGEKRSASFLMGISHWTTPSCGYSAPFSICRACQLRTDHLTQIQRVHGLGMIHCGVSNLLVGAQDQPLRSIVGSTFVSSIQPEARSQHRRAVRVAPG